MEKLNEALDYLSEFDSYSFYQNNVNIVLDGVEELERKLNSATFLIETLEIILSGYNRAATNMCAYEAYKKIKEWQNRA